MSYDNKIYRLADPIPPAAAPAAGRFLILPIYGETSVVGWFEHPPPFPPVGYGSTPGPSPTPRPQPPSTGGGGGRTAGCPASRPHYICWDYYIDPMRPERGTARECMCVTGVTG